MRRTVATATLLALSLTGVQPMLLSAEAPAPREVEARTLRALPNLPSLYEPDSWNHSAPAATGVDLFVTRPPEDIPWAGILVCAAAAGLNAWGTPAAKAGARAARAGGVALVCGLITSAMFSVQSDWTVAEFGGSDQWESMDGADTGLFDHDMVWYDPVNDEYYAEAWSYEHVGGGGSGSTCLQEPCEPTYMH